MHARVVRFTDVSQERVDELVARIEESDGAPPGVESTGLKMFYDADQKTGIVVAFFESREKLDAADEIFDAMDAGDTPGSRASVDRAEVVIERDM